MSLATGSTARHKKMTVREPRSADAVQSHGEADAAGMSGVSQL